jgi:hypothetical protein
VQTRNVKKVSDPALVAGIRNCPRCIWRGDYIYMCALRCRHRTQNPIVAPYGVLYSLDFFQRLVPYRAAFGSRQGDKPPSHLAVFGQTAPSGGAHAARRRSRHVADVRRIMQAHDLMGLFPRRGSFLSEKKVWDFGGIALYLCRAGWPMVGQSALTPVAMLPQSPISWLVLSRLVMKSPSPFSTPLRPPSPPTS